MPAAPGRVLGPRMAISVVATGRVTSGTSAGSVVGGRTPGAGDRRARAVGGPARVAGDTARAAQPYANRHLAAHRRGSTPPRAGSGSRRSRRRRRRRRPGRARCRSSTGRRRGPARASAATSGGGSPAQSQSARELAATLATEMSVGARLPSMPSGWNHHVGSRGQALRVAAAGADRRTGPGAGSPSRRTRRVPLPHRLARGDPLLDDRGQQRVVRSPLAPAASVAWRRGGVAHERMVTRRVGRAACPLRSSRSLDAAAQLGAGPPRCDLEPAETPVEQHRGRAVGGEHRPHHPTWPAAWWWDRRHRGGTSRGCVRIPAERRGVERRTVGVGRVRSRRERRHASPDRSATGTVPSRPSWQRQDGPPALASAGDGTPRRAGVVADRLAATARSVRQISVARRAAGMESAALTAGAPAMAVRR